MPKDTEQPDVEAIAPKGIAAPIYVALDHFGVNFTDANGNPCSRRFSPGDVVPGDLAPLAQGLVAEQ